jgi:mono/diheme cytochrome c family protein
VVTAVIVGGGLLVPWAIRTYWSIRSSNPVRRGIEASRRLGCFTCRELGGGGIPNPGSRDGEVPAWNGGVWMMYVESDDQIRQYITNGISDARGQSPATRLELDRAAIRMPAYGGILDDDDLEDLVASFKPLAEISVPGADTAARRGWELTRTWRCTTCHGPGGSGGVPNPGSFAGFVPGFYGADFADLVSGKAEFDQWILEGSIPRIERHPIAAFFTKRQRLSMPAYRAMKREELDDLWAYAQWLAETEGGASASASVWR